ncbi:MAG: hypothetical protein AAFQ39_03505 [Pseudomonadota bacterium]
MTFKTIALAAAASVALASAASANGFSFNDSDIAGSTAELGQVTAKGAGVVSIYDFHKGEQGALLGTEEISAGANYDVRVNLGKRPVNDVVAVLTVDGQVVDTLELDSRW